jgi:formate dehydrogenase maturation protein FdhE
MPEPPVMDGIVPLGSCPVCGQSWASEAGPSLLIRLYSSDRLRGYQCPHCTTRWTAAGARIPAILRSHP